MARISVVFVAAGVLLIVAAMADASTKSILTTTIEEENPRGQGGFGCAEKMVQQELLSHCRMYLNSITGRGPGNPAQEHLEYCCMQLQNMGSEECMCMGIQMMMDLQGWSQQQGMSEIRNMAQNLPQQCGHMSGSCQMRSLVF